MTHPSGLLARLSHLILLMLSVTGRIRDALDAAAKMAMIVFVMADYCWWTTV
jgi:hypothetical protein